MSTFSCAFWPFVYPLWSYVYSNPFSNFKLSYMSFHYWLVRNMYSGYKSFIMCMIYKYFLPHYGLSFHMLSIKLEKNYILFYSIILICTHGLKLFGKNNCIKGNARKSIFWFQLFYYLVGRLTWWSNSLTFIFSSAKFGD